MASARRQEAAALFEVRFDHSSLEVEELKEVHEEQDEADDASFA
jgi:hypothetical protein